MALAARTTKPGSTTSFTESFGLGNTLQIADLDGDLDAVVASVNAIDDSQIASAANIAGSKLAASSVTDTQLASISGSKISNLGVTLAKLAVGATIAQHVTVALAWTAFLSVEKTIGTCPSLTVTRGGPIVVIGSAALPLIPFAVGSGLLTVRLYRDTTEIAVKTYGPNVIAAQAGSTIPLDVTLFALDTIGTPGTYAYKATVQNDNKMQVGANLFGGSLFAIELA